MQTTYGQTRSNFGRGLLGFQCFIGLVSHDTDRRERHWVKLYIRLGKW